MKSLIFLFLLTDSYIRFQPTFFFPDICKISFERNFRLSFKRETERNGETQNYCIDFLQLCGCVLWNVISFGTLKI